jgi:hypothetical protein
MEHDRIRTKQPTSVHEKEHELNNIEQLEPILKMARYCLNPLKPKPVI